MLLYVAFIKNNRQKLISYIIYVKFALRVSNSLYRLLIERRVNAIILTWRMFANVSDCSENIKKYRIKANLTQKELADKLGVSFQTVSKYENGINEPDLSTLRLMSVIFGCPLVDLIGDEEPRTETVSISKEEEQEEQSVRC